MVDVELIRPRHLIEAEGLSVGSRIHFEIEELNTSGEAEILAITSCPDVPSGDGSVVTGRFATRRVDRLAAVRLTDSDGRESLLEGTPIHPVWLVTRREERKSCWESASHIAPWCDPDMLRATVARSNPGGILAMAFSVGSVGVGFWPSAFAQILANRQMLTAEPKVMCVCSESSGRF